MLILSRRVGEVLCIGDEIAVTIMAVRDDEVSLGVTAPARILVDRQEVRARIAVEGRKAAFHE
jgi:carbon storage regulator